MTMGPIGILAAMDEELAILNQHVSDKVHSVRAGVRFTNGRIDGQEVVLGQCGIGKVNAAMATTLMQMLFSPRAILNTGTAGGLRNDFQVGDIVLGESTLYHDVDATAFGYAYGQVPREPERFTADPTLLASGRKAASGLSDVRIHMGIIASGDVFLGDEKSRALVISRFPDIAAVEMEAAAIAQVCFHLGVPCLIVRAVSDLAENDAKITHEEFLRIAADNSARLVISLLCQIPGAGPRCARP
jgi:adenosylhomocysteine nucleosidase